MIAFLAFDGMKMLGAGHGVTETARLAGFGSRAQTHATKAMAASAPGIGRS